MLLSYLFLAGCTQPRTQLDWIRERGEIRIVTRNGPTTYFLEKDQETGLEYELASRFADRLGLKLKIVIARNTAEIIDIITRGKADLAAAALISDYSSDNPLMFGPSYQWVTRQVVYRNGHRRPASLDDIYPDYLDLANGTIQSLHLARLREAHPSLSWHVHINRDNHELLEMIENGEILYTVANSNELALARQYYPEIRAAFNLSPPQPLAWAFKKSDDQSLVNAVRQFYDQISNNGELAELIEHFYGPVEFFDYVDSRKFVDRIRKRLPKLKPLFEQAAKSYHIDWRMLAAVSYQESHWDEHARSPTGVRGLMMLTLDTAKSIGVTNRLNPKQSIMGGTKYLKKLVDRIPGRIKQPDRTWFALAAYNTGFGHLEDARILTEKQGGDPDSWQEVKTKLPLLSRKKWYRQTKHGFARGVEPVKFVEKIRKYYNVLVQLTQPDIVPSQQLVETILVNSPVL
ncbi:MAG: membrane-bound lytic murein transglycosylase MltF [Gammaproteobacteria bacterium]